ncbi:MAG: alpha/beta fold hydrolase [Candidatus Omnitrophota bacterium]|nr:alpha/beta fold hydrolase [Candidatus Omnitrophota bacterium]MBU1929655.1 alpha/beta fold hydrolase [Candidatus Omnitrophota bacterium]MBU2035389.1 alpha/beta fold hydrolase [Candidatus Omnitrophota bacterium]MBU2222258.1 alpha/beta fold hydrolase [Candidatus Omnitrophota bacterium]MBU2258554.1 alpha/beta fold hydrolase [Candidatus Omnitrophota bacterium]
MQVKFHIGFGKRVVKELPVSPNQNGIFLKGSNGSTVILIHGLTGTPNEMKFLANFLNKKGYSVACPRLANHDQPLDILKNTKWQEFYQSVKDAFLNVNTGSSGKIFVAGLSMGALFSLLLAEEFPDKVSGVSCLSPTLFYDGWNTTWMKHLLPLVYFSGLRHFLYFKEDPPYGVKNEGVRRMIARYYKKAGFSDLSEASQFGYPYFPVNSLYQLDLSVKYLIKRLGRINTPVQLIQAKEDDMTSVKNSEFIYNRVNSSVKEMVLLEDSYHVITADQERDKVAQKMLEFFERINGK